MRHCTAAWKQAGATRTYERINRCSAQLTQVLALTQRQMLMAYASSSSMRRSAS